MSKFIISIIVAAATLATAAPSFAADQVKEVKAKAMQKNGETVYCVKREITTGSILRGNICMTREQWTQANVTVVASAKADAPVKTAQN